MVSTPLNKRSRACDACHSIKTKCELGSQGGDPPCERCIRLGKECVISPPKRQKDRVAELEAQVAALTKQLESQNLQLDAKQGLLQSEVASKKRRLEYVAADLEEDEKDVTMFTLDSVLPLALQKTVFERYLKSILPQFELILGSDPCSYDDLKKQNPWLLMAVIYAACNGVVSPSQEDQIAKLVFDNFVPTLSSSVGLSLETVQAIQMITMWYRIPKQFVQIDLDYFANLAATIATQMGIPSGSKSSTIVPQDTGMVCRSWLVCYLLSMSVAAITRHRSKLSWARREDTALLVLEYSSADLPRDRMVAQYVRGERLCESIADKCQLFESSTFIDVASMDAQIAISASLNLILDWKTQIPSDLSCSALRFWEHTATILATERVLHTLTNAESFTGPYVAERLSVTDFPAPIVQPEHISSILTLRDSCHALLDLFTSLDMAALVSLPPIIFLTKALYAQWILIKIWIALTAAGNTLGAFVDEHSLCIDEYLTKMTETGRRAANIYPTGITGRILSTSLRTKSWLLNCRSTLNVSLPASQVAGDESLFIPENAINWDWNELFSSGIDDSYDSTAPST